MITDVVIEPQPDESGPVDREPDRLEALQDLAAELMRSAA